MIEIHSITIQNLTGKQHELEMEVGENENSIAQLNVSDGEDQRIVIQNMTRDQDLLKTSIAEINTSMNFLKPGKIYKIFA